MGKRYSTTVTTDNPIVTTTETVAATVAGVSTPRANVKVGLKATVQVTTGTNTTALTVRLRRGTAITDTLVGEANPVQVAAAAGSTEECTIMWEDAPGDVAGQSYVVTIQQTAASANGSILAAYIQADVDF